MLSLCLHGPHIIPVVPVSSPYHPCCPHIITIAPRRSPCGPHGCGLRGLLCCLRGLHPMLSPCPHIVPVIPTSSLYHPRHPHIVPIAPRRSPCGPHSCGLQWSPLLSLLSPPDVVPMVPVVPISSPCHPRVIPIIPTSSRRSPHYP